MQRHHAVVIGGSMGGLVAAGVLARYYERVTVVERDAYPPMGEHRRGVPQGRHTHGLLASGNRVLEDLFPGLTAQLIGAGALQGDIVRDSRWFHEGGCLARPTSGLDGLLVSRPLLESQVRERVRALPNLEILENATVEGLAGADGGRVSGLRYRKNGEQHELATDLVVDASGRGSKIANWLNGLGYDAPVQEKLEISLSYTTRHFRRERHHLGGDIAAVVPSTPAGKRGGVILAQEGGRWIVTLISHFGPGAPAELEGFREYARSLPASCIHEVVRDAEPIGEAATAHFPASVRRRYERLQRFPEGLLVFGDAIYSFNPIYGQGMSVAALESQTLDRCLKSGGARLAQRFFRQAAQVVDIPWSIAAGNDLRMPETTGKRGAGVRFINWYVAKLHRAAHADPVLSCAFHRVANLLAPPPSLLSPAMAWRVLRGNLRSRYECAPLAAQRGADPLCNVTE